ncbi:MAG: PAS domain S-box protein [Candidatus Methanoperedens sp.]|nr:PAS domain S-box protein [Candidatus Methanoperedens sp.]
MKILIVDDDENSRVYLERALKSQNYTVESAANGVLALEKALFSPPDMIISDILMPEMNGFDLCRKIKANEKLQHIPFIFYTATFIDKSDEELAMSLGASRFIVKPIELQEFFKIITDVIEEQKEKKLPVPGKTLMGIEKILKLNRIYAVITQINQAIVKVHDKDKILSEACRIAVEYGKFQMAWIGMIDEKSSFVNPVAYSGVEDGYLSKIKEISVRDVPSGSGPTGTSIREGRYYVCDDMEKEPRMALWKEEALKRGYRSSIALPIKHLDKVIGAFSICSSVPHFFEKEEIHLLNEVTNDISFALDSIEIAKEKQQAEEELKRIEWMLSSSQVLSIDDQPPYTQYQEYGDLTGLNHNGIILTSVGKSSLADIVKSFPNLLESSSAVYEKNGDYASGIFTSKWCRILDMASRKLCNTENNAKALNSGKWLCHGSCWTCSKKSIEKRAPVDIECNGGIRLYAIPIFAGDDVIGSINFGYGDPPRDPVRLREIADLYKVDCEELRKEADSYNTRPAYIVEMAKKNLHASARLIGELVRRKISEKALQKSESRFWSIYQQSPVAIELYDSNGLLIDANPKCLEMFGVSDIQKIIGFKLFEDPNITDELKKKISLGEVVKFESEFDFDKVKKMGLYETSRSGRIYIDCTISPWEIADTQQGYLVHVMDITQRKRAEEALRESEAIARARADELAALMDAIPTITFIAHDPDCRHMTSSRMALRLLRLADGANTSKSASESELPDTFRPMKDGRELRPEELPVQLAAATGQDVRNFELTLAFNDGTTCDIFGDAVPLFDAQGKVRGAVGAFLDITQRKQAEEKLREASLYTRNLIEASLDPLVTISKDGKITDVNIATELVTGVSREQLIGSDFSEYFTEPEKARQGYEEVFEKGFVKDYPLAIRHVSGSVTDVLYNATMYKNAAGNVTGVFASARDVSERKRLEYIARAERQRFYDVLEMLPVYVILLTPDYHVSFSNRFFRERFGESNGRRCFEFLFERNEPCEICETYTILKTMAPHEWEWTGPDSHNYYVFDYPFTDTDGSVLILEMGIDITQKKRAEESLRESEKKYRTIVETAHEGIWRLDASEKTSYVNFRMAQMLGYTAEEMLGRHFFHFMDTDARIEAEKNLERRKQGIIETHDFRFSRKDGTDMWAIVSTNPIFDDNGQYIGALGMITDITERKQAEEALAASAEFTNSLISSLQDGFSVLDTKGVHLDVNPAMCRMTGFSREELIGVGTPHPYWPPEEYEHIQAAFQKTLRSEASNFELTFMRKNGERFPVIISPSTVKDRKGDIISYTATVKDITERKRAEDALRQSEEKFFKAFLATPDAIEITRVSDERLIDVNEVFVLRSGYSRDEVVGHTTLEFDLWANPQDRERYFTTMKEQGSVREQEAQFLTKSGEILDGLVSGETFSMGEEMHILTIIRDITRRKLAEEALAVHTRQQETIANLGQIGLKGMELQELFDEAVKQIARALKVELCKVLELVPDKSALLLRAGVGWKEGLVGHATVGIGLVSQAGFTLQSKEPVIVEDLSTETRFHGPAILEDHHVVSGMSTIIGTPDEPLGVLGAHTTYRRTFTEQDIDFLHSAANLLADAIWRKKAEKALRESEEKYRTIVETTNEGIWMLGEDLMTTSVNSRMAEMIGYRTEEMTGRPMTDFMFKEDVPDHLNIMKNRRRGEAEHYERRYCHKNGQTVWTLASAVPIMDAGQNFKGSFAMFADITKRKQAEEALQKSEKCLREAQGLAQIGSWDWDARTDTIAWSPEYYRIYNIDPKMPAPNYLDHLKVYTPESAKKLDAAVGISMNTGEPYELELELIIPDEKRHWVYAKGEAKFDSNGQIVGLRGTSQNITERKKAEEEIYRLNAELEQKVIDRTEDLKKKNNDIKESQRALMSIVEDMNVVTSKLETANKSLLELDRMKSMFIASTSHELRTPLNSIIGFSSILLEGWSGDLTDEQKEQLHLIHNSGKHLLSLINDIIDISKVEAGKIETYYMEFRLRDVLEEARSTIETSIDEKGLVLTIEAPDINMNTDRRRLLQCMINLLSNAAKYTEKGNITVIAKNINGRIDISVSDTGIGIKTGDITKLFAPFVRLESPISAATSGTGLGLYLTKKLVKDVLGGEVDVKSEYGKGSTFTLHIPIKPEETK